MSTFKNAFIVGILLSFFSRFFRQIFDFLATIFLARVLSPSDFGLFGTAYLFMGLMYFIYDLGLGAALVQKKEVDEADYSTVFWVGIIIGFGFTVFSYLISPFIAAFFNSQQIEALIKTLAFLFLVLSPVIVSRARLARELRFGRIAFIDSFTTAMYGIGALTFAHLGYGVWSIVWGSYVANILALGVIFVLSPYMPRFVFSVRRLLHLFRFGSGAAGGRAAEYLSDNIDYLFVGRFLGAYALGIYTFAFNLATFPVRKLAPIVTDVFFPAFSKLQESAEQTRHSYLRVLSFVSFAVMPFLIALFLETTELVRLVYGSHWLEAVPLIRILVLGSYFGVLWSVTQSLLLSQGKSHLGFTYGLVRFLFLFVLLPVGVTYGTAGVAFIVSLYFLFVVPILQTVAARELGIGFSLWGNEVVKTVCCALVMGLFMYGFSFISLPQGIGTLLRLCVGFGLYGLALFVVKRSFYRDCLMILALLRRRI